MPQIMENGTREMQLTANMLMAKILLKMGSLEMKPTGGKEEESKEEPDWSESIDKKSYQNSFFS